MRALSRSPPEIHTGSLIPLADTLQIPLTTVIKETVISDNTHHCQTTKPCNNMHASTRCVEIVAGFPEVAKKDRHKHLKQHIKIEIGLGF